MKKIYMTPEVNITYVEAQKMIAASVTAIEGVDDIDIAGDAPDNIEADAKQNVNTVQWESWEDVEDPEK